MAAERGEAVLKTAVRWTRAAVEGVTSKLLNIVYRGEESILPEVTNDLLLESACNLAARIRTGELKSRALVQAYIRRIIAVDPVINAVVDERFIEALDEAARVDELVASGRKTVDEIERETPFLGIPFSAKEATLVKGLSSTSGLMCRQGLKANRDCEAVALLKGAGAILLVVTNTSELCMWWETYNKLHGRTNNPYDITRTSGGSSGGEAALIASAGSVIGIATDLGGSIRLPAFFNGVFGHKPSQGAVPHGGQFPPILQQVSPYVVTGPMSRYASDLLPMLRVLADGEARRLDLHSKVSLRSLRVFYVLDKGDFSAMTPVQPEITNALLEVKSLEVVEVFIARIEEVQPIINAVVDSRFEEAREEAKAIDDFIRSGEKSEEQLADETPLLGVPFTSKNVVPVKGLLCSAGLVARRSTRATEDCAAVALMRRAGAIPLATTNSSEMCMWWAESYNLVHGRTSNPYNTSRTAGGSSGGEGALLGAAGSVIGLGNDIGGSVRFPAFCNGIFAHKATTGIISNRGQIPPLTGKLDEYQATGPMCRYASDLRTVLSVLACDHADRLRLHSPVNLKTLKMYYMEDDGGHPFVTPVHRDVKHALKKVLDHFQSSYGVDPVKVCLEGLSDGYAVWARTLSMESSLSMAAQLKEGKGELEVGLELMKSCFGLSDHTFPVLVQAALQRATKASIVASAAETAAICRRLKRDLEALLKGGEGVFLFPTHPEPAPYHRQPLFKPLNGGYTRMFNLIGFPVTQCMTGLSTDGLPVGIQVVGAMGYDRVTIAVAEEVENAFGGWVTPSPDR